MYLVICYIYIYIDMCTVYLYLIYADAGIGFGTLVSVFYRDATKLLMAHDIADATCRGLATGEREVLGRTMEN